MNRVYNGSMRHCYLAGSLLINHIYLFSDSKFFTKELNTSFEFVCVSRGISAHREV